MAMGFLARAALGAMLVSLTLSLLSGFVVLKRLAFSGSGMAHAAFGGVALALLLGLPPAPVAVVFSLAVAYLVTRLSRDGGLPEDSAIGIFFAASMAFGVIVLSFHRGYNVDLFSLLFGNLLAVQMSDLYMMAGLAAVVSFVVGRYFWELISVAFDEDLATVGGLPVRGLNLALMVLLALAVILSMKAVGLILVSALLVLPGATALELAGSLRSFVGLSILFGLLAAATGLAASYALNLASGAAIVLSGTLIFLLVHTLRRSRRR
ncbi:MAG: metal ABC transporter permease [Candidatus Eisenbacteria bacterium]|nr:metal ABC transporter permease [Candidatus Eisenbacteria bacterium]